MGKVISNATPLIYLAKADKLGLLKKVFRQVIIPEEVKNEIVDEGKKLGEMDAYLVEQAIKEGWIKVLNTKELIEIPLQLEKGEIAVLSLAKNMNVEEVLIDEAPARLTSEILEIKPRGTIFVLLKALDKEHMGFDEFLSILDGMIEVGFRLKEEVYIRAIQAARRITYSECH